MLFFQLLYEQYSVRTIKTFFWILFNSIAQIYLVSAFNGFLNQTGGGVGGLVIGHKILLFITLFAFVFYSQKHFLMEVASLSQDALHNLRMRVIHKINTSELLDLEKIGIHKILTRLGTELDTANNYMTWVTQVVSSLCLVVAGNIYLVMISPTLPIVLNFVLFPLWIYNNFYKKVEVKQLTKDLDKYRTKYASALENILKGTKELKINSRKREMVFETYDNRLQKADEAQEQKGKILGYTQVYYNYAMALVAVLSVLLLGSLGYIPKDKLFLVLMMTLFLEAATFRVIFAIEGLFNVNIALNNINLLEEELKVDENEKNISFEPKEGDEESKENKIKKMPFQKQIKLRDIRFNYGGEHNFGIGPINLTLKKGEVIFIAGENGSGKSTLLKTITGLYPKTAGSIEVDGILITPANIKRYQELFAVVFADFHLFQELYGLQDVNEDWVYDLLNLLQLSHKTAFENNRFTNVDLSTGQKKRLAVLSSFLEKKEIYIFDEVAADQDTEQKNFFYDVVLQELKKANKTVIVVSHDGPYTDTADRVMEIKRTPFGSTLQKQKNTN